MADKVKQVFDRSIFSVWMNLIMPIATVTKSSKKE